MASRPAELLVATLNPGKRREIAELLSDLSIRVLHLGDLDPLPDCEEDGSTFMENALKKGRHYHSLTGLPTLADDSGLVIAALGGLPGIRSARFAGPGASDTDRVRKVLSLMQEVPEERRDACFVCALVFFNGLEAAFQAEERAEGRIILTPSGCGGFGYDPIFLFPESGKTFAELESNEKNRISHRGKALARFRQFLAAAPK